MNCDPDEAYEEGFMIGFMHGAEDCPHPKGTAVETAWRNGFNDGTSTRIAIARKIALAEWMPAGKPN